MTALSYHIVRKSLNPIAPNLWPDSNSFTKMSHLCAFQGINTKNCYYTTTNQVLIYKKIIRAFVNKNMLILIDSGE